MPTSSDRGLFVWHELNTTDVVSADAFYSKLIGWKTVAWEPNPAYKLWTMGRASRGGLHAIRLELGAAPTPPHWLSYVATLDVDATVRQAVELGGKVVTPAYDVSGFGRMAVLQDPQGAMFAVSAQAERSGFKEPQAGDFSWHELLTNNWQTAFEFYAKLFGWEKMTAMDMGPGGIYQIYGTGGHQLGGMFTPPGYTGTPMWVPYIMVRDARRTADAAKALGATIVHGPMEVPGGGWIFTGVDLQGVMFATHSQARSTTNDESRRSTKSAARRSTKNTKNTKGAARRATKSTKGTKAAKPVRRAGLQSRRSTTKHTTRKKTAKKRR